MKLPRWSALPLALVAWLSLPCASAAAETPREAARCLALAMYWEAKTEGADGMRAVASVVLNRRAHPEFPDTVCGVVKQGGETPPCQFSWWCDGKSDRPTEAAAWQLAQSLALSSLDQAGAGCDARRAVLPRQPAQENLAASAAAHRADRPAYLLPLRPAAEPARPRRPWHPALGVDQATSAGGLTISWSIGATTT